QPARPRPAARADDARHLVVGEEAVQVGEPLFDGARRVDVAPGDGAADLDAEPDLLEALDPAPQAAGIDGARRRAHPEHVSGTQRAGTRPGHSTRRVAPPSTAIVVPVT